MSTVMQLMINQTFGGYRLQVKLYIRLFTTQVVQIK